MYQVSTSISADNTSKRQHVLLFGVLVCLGGIQLKKNQPD